MTRAVQSLLRSCDLANRTGGRQQHSTVKSNLEDGRQPSHAKIILDQDYTKSQTKGQLTFKSQSSSTTNPPFTHTSGEVGAGRVEPWCCSQMLKACADQLSGVLKGYSTRLWLKISFHPAWRLLLSSLSWEEHFSKLLTAQNGLLRCLLEGLRLSDNQPASCELKPILFAHLYLRHSSDSYTHDCIPACHPSTIINVVVDTTMFSLMWRRVSLQGNDPLVWLLLHNYTVPRSFNVKPYTVQYGIYSQQNYLYYTFLIVLVFIFLMMEMEHPLFWSIVRSKVKCLKVNTVLKYLFAF